MTIAQAPTIIRIRKRILFRALMWGLIFWLPAKTQFHCLRSSQPSVALLSGSPTLPRSECVQVDYWECCFSFLRSAGMLPSARHLGKACAFRKQPGFKYQAFHGSTSKTMPGVKRKRQISAVNRTKGAAIMDRIHLGSGDEFGLQHLQ